MAQIVKLMNHAETEVDDDFVAKRGANVILWVIAGFFALFLAWAALTKVDRTVRGLGRVVPSSKLQVVSNLEGGVIEQILVRPGQMVRKGDILVRLSPKQSGALLGSSTATVEALRARVSRLSAEVRGQEPQLTGPADQVAVERALHTARSAELAGLTAAGEARAEQARRALREAESNLAARRSSLTAAREELDMLRPLAARQIVAQIDLVKAENAARVAQSEVDSAEAAVARAGAGIAEARAATAQARSDWMGRAGNELSQAQAELTAQQQSLPALSDRVDRTVIRAPMSGRINRMLVTTVGGSVSAGMPIAEVVPADNVLYIETMVKPSDIANVRLGQPARVEVTAYTSAIFGTLEGVVTSISPDAVVNEKTGESWYTVEVQTRSMLRDTEGKSLPIGPGMMANVSLLGDKRSVLSYLFTPITRLGETAFRE